MSVACWVVVGGMVGCMTAPPEAPPSGEAPPDQVAVVASAAAPTQPDATTTAAHTAAPAEVLPEPSSDTATAEPAAPPPAAIDYPFTGLAMLADDCADATVVVTTAPEKVGWDYDWIWTRQALYANPQFRVVPWPGEPDKAMDVRMDVYAIDGGFALVGACGDGATCNKLAAMYKRTVPSCKPVLHCGDLPLSSPRRSHMIPEDGDWLPHDLTGQCARIGVCMMMQPEGVPGNPGLACQENPKRFKTRCAEHPTCDEVVACLRG